jgi:hypothetical protein
MLRIATVAALAFGFYLTMESAPLPAERNFSPPCKPLAKLLADFDAKTHFAVLTPGQFHFAEGLYVASPTTPDGLPPGNGALLATHDGAHVGIVIWTRGPLACAPIPINEKLMKLFSSIKTGLLDSEGNEL